MLKPKPSSFFGTKGDQPHRPLDHFDQQHWSDVLDLGAELRGFVEVDDTAILPVLEKIRPWLDALIKNTVEKARGLAFGEYDTQVSDEDKEDHHAAAVAAVMEQLRKLQEKDAIPPGFLDRYIGPSVLSALNQLEELRRAAEDIVDIPPEVVAPRDLDPEKRASLPRDPEAALQDKERREPVTRAAENVLNDRQIAALDQRMDGESFEEIGKGFEVSRERTRQIEAKAMARLRREVRAESGEEAPSDRPPDQSRSR